jgi:hypothetical protein
VLFRSGWLSDFRIICFVEPHSQGTVGPVDFTTILLENFHHENVVQKFLSSIHSRNVWMSREVEVWAKWVGWGSTGAKNSSSLHGAHTEQQKRISGKEKETPKSFLARSCAHSEALKMSIEIKYFFENFHSFSLCFTQKLAQTATGSYWYWTERRVGEFQGYFQIFSKRCWCAGDVELAVPENDVHEKFNLETWYPEKSIQAMEQREVWQRRGSI